MQQVLCKSHYIGNYIPTADERRRDRQVARAGNGLFTPMVDRIPSYLSGQAGGPTPGRLMHHRVIEVFS